MKHKLFYSHTQEREGRNEHLDLIELKNMHIRNTLRPDGIPISVLSWLPTSNLDNHYPELGIYQGLVSLQNLYKAHFPKFFFFLNVFNLVKKSYRMHFEILFHNSRFVKFTYIGTQRWSLSVFIAV